MSDCRKGVPRAAVPPRPRSRPPGTPGIAGLAAEQNWGDPGPDDHLLPPRSPSPSPPASYLLHEVISPQLLQLQGQLQPFQLDPLLLLMQLLQPLLLSHWSQLPWPEHLLQLDLDLDLLLPLLQQDPLPLQAQLHLLEPQHLLFQLGPREAARRPLAVSLGGSSGHWDQLLRSAASCSRHLWLRLPGMVQQGCNLPGHMVSPVGPIPRPTFLPALGPGWGLDLHPVGDTF